MQNRIEQQRTDGEANGVTVITNRTQRELNKWVAHGVLWSVVNPLWSGLRALGFKEQLLKDPDIALNEAAITATLTQWHQHLDATRLYQQFESELERVRALPEQQQLHRWVHGKSFFNQVVNPVLNDLIGQQGADQRQTLLFRSYPSPVDFEPLWRKMGLLPS